MKAMQVNNSTQGPALIAAELPQPQPGEGELLIQCPCGRGNAHRAAAGIRRLKTTRWYAHAKVLCPGMSSPAVIAGLGKNSKGFEVGQEVYGFNDWFADGATAEFCVTRPESIAGKPATLTHEAAATVPIGALTAWQGLLERAKMQPGERVLVHGAAGSVGIFAVQLAHLRGAHVIATASVAQPGN